MPRTELGTAKGDVSGDTWEQLVEASMVLRLAIEQKRGHLPRREARLRRVAMEAVDALLDVELTFGGCEVDHGQRQEMGFTGCYRCGERWAMAPDPAQRGTT